MNSYMTRALRARDPRFARILGSLGYERTDLVASEPKSKPKVQLAKADDLTALRDQYFKAIGKRPYHGWDADALRAKIKEAGAD